MNLIILKNVITRFIFIYLFIYSQSLVAAEKTENNLFDFSGNEVNLTAYIESSQWTVVMLWLSDCHICNVEAQQFVKLHTDFSDKHIRVLGISIDGKTNQLAAEQFIQSHNINFPNLIAEVDVAMDMYTQLTRAQWVGTPSFMIFSPSGKIMAHRSGMLPAEMIIQFIEKQPIIQ